MSERLVVRLGSHAEQAIHWLVWSRSESEIIASGELAGSHELAALATRAGGRPIIALLPSCDISFKAVELPSRSNKQLLNALPYMLEEQLSSDVDSLHFSVLEKQGNNVTVAIVADTKMRQWQAWLAEAELSCEQFIPDVLTLPLVDGFSAVQLEQQWLIRQGRATGMSVDAELLPFVLAIDEDSEAPQVQCYSNISDYDIAGLEQAPIELPMKLCAQGAISSSVNLLQGEYQVAKAENLFIKHWRGTTIAAVVAVVMIFSFKLVQLQQLQQQKIALDNDIKQVYVQVFKPKKMRLNTRLIKKQMQSRLRQLQGGRSDNSFLAMLDQLTPTLAKSPSVKAISMRFDQKQNSLRLQASAADFQTFTGLKNALSQQYKVSEGALNQRENGVQGTLEIRGRN